MAFDKFEGADRDKTRVEIGSDLCATEISAAISAVPMSDLHRPRVSRKTLRSRMCSCSTKSRPSRQLAEASECKSPTPELLIPGAAAPTRVVSMAGIRLGSEESARAFKGIICVDISEFESHMPSQAVGSLWAMSGLQNCDAISRA
jgi:hypothetical protein